MALLKAVARAGRGILHGGWWRLCLAGLVAGLAATAASAQTGISREYQIKAVFLFNFVQFVEWPAAAFPDTAAPIRIGVLGDDPFGPALDDAVRGETIRSRQLVVERSHNTEDLRDCHLVFVSKSEGRRIGPTFDQLLPHPILTVSELDGFARHGGVIAFFNEGKKLRFEINTAAAQRAGLKISSELLSLGRIVQPAVEKEKP